MNEKLVNKFGYSEMYEWNIFPGNENKFARFVQFNKLNPDKINLAYDKDLDIVGVSSVNYAVVSDNPDEWHLRYISNEFGDTFMQKERLAVGNKVYDQVEEFSYIRTFPYEQYIPIQNEKYNKNIQYSKRTNRNEWVAVTMIGKAIVVDNGKCNPGEYCIPQFSEITTEAGIAIPGDKNEKNSFYVISRVSENTIMILMK